MTKLQLPHNQLIDLLNVPIDKWGGKWFQNKFLI